MADDVDEGGWCYVTDGVNEMWLACEKIEVDIIDKLTRQRIPGDSGFKFSLSEISRQVKLTNVYFNSHANIHHCIDNLVNWNLAGEFRCKIIRNSGGSYADIYGSGSTTLWVLFQDVRGIEKISRGDRQVWVIKQMILLE